jgi:hypothetical protein
MPIILEEQSSTNSLGQSSSQATIIQNKYTGLVVERQPELPVPLKLSVEQSFSLSASSVIEKVQDLAIEADYLDKEYQKPEGDIKIVAKLTPGNFAYFKGVMGRIGQSYSKDDYVVVQNKPDNGHPVIRYVDDKMQEHMKLHMIRGTCVEFFAHPDYNIVKQSKFDQAKDRFAFVSTDTAKDIVKRKLIKPDAHILPCEQQMNPLSLAYQQFQTTKSAALFHSLYYCFDQLLDNIESDKLIYSTHYTMQQFNGDIPKDQFLLFHEGMHQGLVKYPNQTYDIHKFMQLLKQYHRDNTYIEEHAMTLHPLNGSVYHHYVIPSMADGSTFEYTNAKGDTLYVSVHVTGVVQMAYGLNLETVTFHVTLEKTVDSKMTYEVATRSWITQYSRRILDAAAGTITPKVEVEDYRFTLTMLCNINKIPLPGEIEINYMISKMNEIRLTIVSKNKILTRQFDNWQQNLLTNEYLNKIIDHMSLVMISLIILLLIFGYSFETMGVIVVILAAIIYKDRKTFSESADVILSARRSVSNSIINPDYEKYIQSPVDNFKNQVNVLNIILFITCIIVSILPFFVKLINKQSFYANNEF